MNETAMEITGEWQHPENKWADRPDSIHNDEVAGRVGMRGGTIAGTSHLDHFVPLIKEHFGINWYNKGVISMYYTYATMDREDVRAVIEKPSGAADEQIQGRVETPAGRTVAKGTVAMGNPGKLPYIRAIKFENAPADQVRILSALKVGDAIAERQEISVPDQGETGAYAGYVTKPSEMFTMLEGQLPRDKIAQAVGFYGGTEILLHDGPIRVETTYRSTAKVVCIGASPKTEMIFVDSIMHEQDSGKVVATMRKITRFMKAGAPIWEGS